ncbi:hypothetical protein V8G54_008290 [Vigna mungo]|uniref:Uncharacterized protein n=1 Tax=Vigna mungo TaxID=3915 RepID=A0AAQ3P3Y8_VIGMU
MEVGCAMTTKKVALGFEPFPLFAIGFRLFSSATLLMLCGGEMKVQMVGWVRVSAGGGEERECKGCHGGDLEVMRVWQRHDLLHLGFEQVSSIVVVGSRVEWRNS